MIKKKKLFKKDNIKSLFYFLSIEIFIIITGDNIVNELILNNYNNTITNLKYIISK